MKKLLIVAVLVLGGIYGTGMITLGEGGTTRFLNRLEEHTMQADTQQLCDLLTDDFVVDINDHTTGRNNKIQGGKSQMCAYYKTVTPAMALLQPSTQLERRNLIVKRDWLHPWTAHVTFTEFRTTSIPRAGVDLKTESDDQYILVRSAFGGVKIKSVKSEVFTQE